MLDTVPDKVLVCSIEGKDDLKTTPIYNNRQMREFFGQSFVTTKTQSSHTERNPKAPSKKTTSKVRRLTAFTKRIFRQRENPIQDGQNDL